jgi:alanyl-tRNA synthetase
LKLLAAPTIGLAAEDAPGQGATVALASASSGDAVLARSAEGKLDLGALLREVLAELGGKGGGSAAFAQGSLASPAKAAEFLDRMKAKLAAGL